MWRIAWAPNNASKWQVGFNLAFKGLTYNFPSERHEGILVTVVFSWINFTSSQGLGEGIFSKPRVMDQVGRVRKGKCRADQCISAVWAVELPVFVCLRSTCNPVTEVGRL